MNELLGSLSLLDFPYSIAKMTNKFERWKILMSIEMDENGWNVWNLDDLVLIHIVKAEGRVRYLSINLSIDNLDIILNFLKFLFLLLNIPSILKYI